MNEDHPDWVAFRRAIEANPTDTAPRLVFADWLEDNERPDEARIQRLASKVPVFVGSREHQQIVAHTGTDRKHPDSPFVSVGYGVRGFRTDRNQTRVEGNRTESRDASPDKGRQLLSFSREHDRTDPEHDNDVRRSVAEAMEHVVRRDPDHAERVLS
jgi:uncharacterized protein (TIGR02996 family)